MLREHDMRVWVLYSRICSQDRKMGSDASSDMIQWQAAKRVADFAPNAAQLHASIMHPKTS